MVKMARDFAPRLQFFYGGCLVDDSAQTCFPAGHFAGVTARGLPGEESDIVHVFCTETKALRYQVPCIGRQGFDCIGITKSEIMHFPEQTFLRGEMMAEELFADMRPPGYLGNRRAVISLVGKFLEGGFGDPRSSGFSVPHSHLPYPPLLRRELYHSK